MIVGYKLMRVSDGAEIKSWGGVYGSCPSIPNPLILPNGDHVCCASPNVTYGDDFMLVEWEMEKPPQTVFDGVDFLSRVTDEEYGAIVGAATANVQIGRWLDIFRLRGEIDVTGATARAAKAGLVAGGLLTQERADAIFATA